MKVIRIKNSDNIVQANSELMEWLNTCVERDKWSVVREVNNLPAKNKKADWGIRFYDDADAAAFKLTFGNEL